MTAQHWFRVSLLLALLLAGRLSSAQVLTGTFSGTVKDESGGVLPAAAVSSELASPYFRADFDGYQRTRAVSVRLARSR